MSFYSYILFFEQTEFFFYPFLIVLKYSILWCETIAGTVASLCFFKVGFLTGKKEKKVLIIGQPV
jgi:hypothetical protein